MKRKKIDFIGSILDMIVIMQKNFYSNNNKKIRE